MDDYRHYWALDPTHPETRGGFDQTLADAARIVERSGVAVGSYMLTSDRLVLNGAGEHYGETFLLTRDQSPLVAREQWLPPHLAKQGFLVMSCATARLPYDEVVAAILLRAAAHMPAAFAVDSDGRWDQDWQHGAFPHGPHAAGSPRQLVRRLFGDAADPASSPLIALPDLLPRSRRTAALPDPRIHPQPPGYDTTIELP